MIPKSKRIRSDSHYPKYLCDLCGEKCRARNLILFRKKWYCTNCKNKRKTTIINSSLPYPQKTLQEALDKVYTIRCHSQKQKYLIAYCYFPKALIGKEVKITLVEPGTLKMGATSE